MPDWRFSKGRKRIPKCNFGTRKGGKRKEACDG
jgi:hypothetical protein